MDKNGSYKVLTLLKIGIIGALFIIPYLLLKTYPNEVLTENKQMENFLKNSTLTIKLYATYGISHGWGHVFNCGIEGCTIATKAKPKVTNSKKIIIQSKIPLGE